MRIVHRVSGVLALLVALTGCTVATHASTAIPGLPTCDGTLLALNQLSTSLPTKSHIPHLTPSQMRLCRYRWNENEKKLVLLADITKVRAPAALLKTLSQLKTVNEVYGLNAVFPCPMSQGNVDVLILRGTNSGSKLSVIQAQRDGCGRVVLSHPGSASYVAYLSTARLFAQIDAITAPLAMQTKNLPKIRITPAANFHDGQKVLVQVSNAIPGERFHLSECISSSAAANVVGCGDQLALQPFVDTDSAGAGATLFYLHAKAGSKSNTATDLHPCTDQCVLMATGTTVDGKSAFVYAPLIFSK